MGDKVEVGDVRELHGELNRIIEGLEPELKEVCSCVEDALGVLSSDDFKQSGDVSSVFLKLEGAKASCGRVGLLSSKLKPALEDYQNKFLDPLRQVQRVFETEGFKWFLDNGDDVGLVVDCVSGADGDDVVVSNVKVLEGFFKDLKSDKDLQSRLSELSGFVKGIKSIRLENATLNIATNNPEVIKAESKARGEIASAVGAVLCVLCLCVAFYLCAGLYLESQERNSLILNHKASFCIELMDEYKRGAKCQDGKCPTPDMCVGLIER